MVKSAITSEQEVEIAAAYDSGMKAADVEQQFNISTSNLYRILHKHDVPTHSRRKHYLPIKNYVVVSDTGGDRTVTVDGQDTVQSIVKVERKKNLVVWKITFEGTLMMEGESIFEALNGAKKLPMVQRIVGASIAEMNRE